MPRIETITKTVYKFNELSEEAKEKARDWYRNASSSDFNDFHAESVIDDAKTIGKLFGLEIKDIFYSGFSRQGAGAKFTGKYSHKVGSLRAVKKYAPQDTKLHAIVAGLVEVQKRNRYSIEAGIEVNGRYAHSGCTSIWIGRADGNDVSSDDDDTVQELLRDYMNWIYKRLELEYEYHNSNEQVDESIECNEYEFDESGNIA